MKKLIILAIIGFFTYAFVTRENDDSLQKEFGNFKYRKPSTDSDSTSVETEPNKEISKKYTNEEIEYFNEIALSSEYSDSDKGVVCKWKKDVNIYVIDKDNSGVLYNELKKVVGELNNIIEPININIVEDKSESNFIVCFGSANDFLNITPEAASNVEDNWGLFSVNSGTEIFKGTMYVDIYRCKSINGQKHLLREELTQALGLFNDSYKYKNSIFQQKWTETTEYAPIDIKLIEMLYNN